MATVEMTAVDQTHFTPLSEALCSCIHALNVEGTAAFPHLIVDSLRIKYPHLTPPSIDMIKAALKALQNEGKLRYISSRGFVVLPPETKSITKRLTAARMNSNDVPTLMSNQEAIGKLHGIPGETEITFRSFGVQVDESKLSSSISMTPQYAFECDVFAGNKYFANESNPSLKRSASLRMYPDKSKANDEKSFSFMRSKSLKLQRERQTKSFGFETLASPKSEKKPSMLSKLFTRLSGASQMKRTEAVNESTSAVNSKRDTETKATQTIDATTKKCGKSDTLKSSKSKASSQSNGYTYSHYMPCTCNAYIDQRQYTGCLDRCAYESGGGGRFVCVTELDPNCRHCMASLTNSNVCCNEFISNSYLLEKQAKHRPTQTGKAITTNAVHSWPAVDSTRPKTPLKLNNNKTVSSEKMKPIAMQTNAIRENNSITAKCGGEANECHLTSMDTQHHNENGSNSNGNVDECIADNNAIICNELCENIKKTENEVKRVQLDKAAKKSNSDYKLASANSVNVKIEIGSKMTTATSQPTESLSKRNVSNDAISGSNLGQRLIANCVDDEHSKLSMNAIKAHDKSGSKAVTKNANITSTTVTTSMTVPSVSVTAENHNFTINTVTKTNTNAFKSERILPVQYRDNNKVLTLDDCTCKQKNLIVNALNADLKNNHDDHHLSSLTSIREKVAKAKAAFFNTNNAHAN